MSDWNNQKDRNEAAYNFLKKLEEDPQLREDCLKYPWIARKVFEEIGGFENMPASVEFRAIEDNKGARDNLHILAVPPVGDLGPREQFEVDSLWLGCWNLWIQ